MHDFTAHVRRHLSRLDVPDGAYDDVVEQLASELEARYSALVERGVTDQDAWHEVLAQIPSWSALARELGTTGRPPLRLDRRSRLRTLFGLDRWLHDLTIALRVLWKDRGFTGTAIVTLTICLGGHAAIVAGVNGVLFHPLDVPESERILLMSNQYPRVERRMGRVSATPDYEDRRQHVTVMEEQALYNYTGMTIDIGRVPTRTLGIIGTPSLLRLLRVQPAHGRLFTESEAIPGNDQTIILSDGLWRDLFGRDPAAIGRTVRASGRDFTIVGVLRRGVTYGGADVRFWIPLALTERQRSDDVRHNNGWLSIGRLKPGATIEQVRTQLTALDALNLERTPAKLKPILISTGFYTGVEPLEDVLARDVSGPLSVLWAASIVVLVIGLGNLSNLAFARSRARLGELGTRLAIGAGRFDIARPQLVEGITIGAVGAAAALGVGAAILSTLRAQQLLTAPTVHVDVTVAAITLGLGLLAGVVIGLVSASPVFTMKLESMLHQATRSGTRGRAVRVTRRGLVVVQMACSFVLLVGASLLWVSVRNLLSVDPGFAIDNVLTGTISLPASRYANEEAARALVSRSLESIRQVPGVVAAGATTIVPLRGVYQSGIIFAEGYVPKAGDPPVSGVRSLVSPGYFEATGTPLVRGRFFDDREAIANSRSIVIDEQIARRFWGDEDPIGRRMFRPANAKEFTIGPDTQWLTVVGVVGTARLRGPLAVDDGTSGTYYLPYAVTAPRDVGYVIRTTDDPLMVVSDVRSALARIDPELPLFDIRTMSERTELALQQQTSTMRLATLFAAVAVFLSAIGLYGVLSYLVTQRAREMGVRLALGSAPTGIIGLILREGLALAVAGIVLGTGAAFLLGRFVASQLYGVTPSNPLVMAVMAVTLSAVAALACIVPARRAANVDVMKILSAN